MYICSGQDIAVASSETYCVWCHDDVNTHRRYPISNCELGWDSLKYESTSKIHYWGLTTSKLKGKMKIKEISKKIARSNSKHPTQNCSRVSWHVNTYNYKHGEKKQASRDRQKQGNTKTNQHQNISPNKIKSTKTHVKHQRASIDAQTSKTNVNK